MATRMSYLLVFLGGGIGAALRHGVNVVTLRAFGPGLPWGTFAVNVAGSLAMGLLVGWLAMRAAPNEWRLFAATGLLGGFTTFSAFSLDLANMMERGELGWAVGYVLASVGVSLFALFAGLALVRA